MERLVRARNRDVRSGAVRSEGIKKSRLFFLTFPQTDTNKLVVFSLLEDFAEELIVAEESHADGNKHIHAVFKIKEKAHYEDVKEMIGGHTEKAFNVQTCRNYSSNLLHRIIMSPRVWKKPLTLIYDNNYKYGNSLYCGAIGDIERKYLNAMSRTRLPLDRPDVNMSTFAGSSLVPGGITTTDHSPSDYMGRSYGGSVASRSAYEDDLYDLRRVRSVADFPTYRSKHVPEHWDARSSVRSPNTFSEIENDLEERKSRRRRRQRPIEKVEFPEMPTYTERAADRVDTSHWIDKCRQLQSEINHLSQRVSEAETKVKSESKHKIQQGITELTLMMDDTIRQNAELQKVIKMQAKQLAEIQSQYDEAQRHMTEAAEDLNSTHRRCNAMQAELEALRHTIDQTIRHKDGSLRL